MREFETVEQYISWACEQVGRYEGNLTSYERKQLTYHYDAVQWYKAATKVLNKWRHYVWYDDNITIDMLDNAKELKIAARTYLRHAPLQKEITLWG